WEFSCLKRLAVLRRTGWPPQPSWEYMDPNSVRQNPTNMGYASSFVIASAAKQSIVELAEAWIASSLALLAMTRIPQKRRTRWRSSPPRSTHRRRDWACG